MSGRNTDPGHPLIHARIVLSIGLYDRTRTGTMPGVSEFSGIVIQMYHREHGLPHFHATYGGQTATVGIDPIEVLEGYLPPRQLRSVLEWAGLRRNDLVRNWERASGKETLERIEPLR